MGAAKQPGTAVLGLFADGIPVPRIAARLPLGQARAAIEPTESRTAYGKVVLIP